MDLQRADHDQVVERMRKRAEAREDYLRQKASALESKLNRLQAQLFETVP